MEITHKVGVGIKPEGVITGGKFVCEKPECKYFSTDSFSSFTEHCSNHIVKSGVFYCKECKNLVEIKKLENKPTNSDVNAGLVFCNKCESKFYERRGFKKI